MVRFRVPTAGHEDPSLTRMPIRPESVLVAVTPSAPPSFAAIAVRNIRKQMTINDDNESIRVFRKERAVRGDERTNGHDVGDVGRELHEEGQAHGGAHPPRDVAHELRVLAAREAHAALAHPVRTREVQLERVGAGRLGLARQLLPVVLVEAAHYARDHHLQVKSTSS